MKSTYMCCSVLWKYIILQQVRHWVRFQRTRWPVARRKPTRLSSWRLLRASRLVFWSTSTTSRQCPQVFIMQCHWITCLLTFGLVCFILIFLCILLILLCKAKCKWIIFIGWLSSDTDSQQTSFICIHKLAVWFSRPTKIFFNII